MRSATITHRNANFSRSLRHNNHYVRITILKFQLFTYHHVLNWLFKIIEQSGRLTPWIIRLAAFEFEIKYKKGADNHHTDVLSILLSE